MTVPTAQEPRYRRPMPSFRPFKEVEAERPDFDPSLEWHYTKTPNPEWKIGGGASTPAPKSAKMVQLDPNDRKRDPIDNYSLMISGYGPRPVAFASTISKDGKGNLSPFSYTTFVNHDPPTMIIGFSPKIKDTFRNIIDTGEVVINMISEDFVEAANMSCIDAPSEVSEWALTGLTKTDSAVVKPPRVGESLFAVECKLMEYKLLNNTEGQQTGGYAVLEGVMFHIREDAMDAEMTTCDQKVLKNVVRMGGITFGRVTSGYELPRPFYSALTAEEKALVEEQ